MLAHLENANIATVAQSKPHIVAKCSVYGVLVPKYATIPLFLMGCCPLEHWKKFGPKKKKAFFWMANHQKVYFFGIRPLENLQKRVLRTILLLENSMGTKLKVQKNSGNFQFLDLRVQWKFHVFKKKIRGKGVVSHSSEDIL